MLANKIKPVLKWYQAMEVFGVALLFTLSLGIRLSLLFEYPHVLFLHEADASVYFNIAKSIVNTWGLGDTSVHYPPFYPFVIAIISLFTSDIEIAGRLASSVMGALLVLPVYFIGKEIYDRKIGFLSTVPVIFLGAFVDYSLQPITQTTYLTLLTTGLYLGIVLIKRCSLKVNILSGFVFGAAYLTRPEALLVFVFVLIVVIIATLVSSTQIKQKLTAVSIQLIIFLIMALPYINYLHKQTGIWTISGKAASPIYETGIDASARLLPSGKTLGESMKGKVGLANAFPSLQEFARTYVKNMFTFTKVFIDNFPAPYLIFSIIGFLISLVFIFSEDEQLWRVRLFQIAIMLGGIVAVLPVFVFNISSAVSYILPLFPMAIIFLSRGLSWVEDTLFGVIGNEYLKQWALVSAAVIIFFSYSSFLPFWKNMSSEGFRYFAASQNFFLKDTGEWLKYNTLKGTVVMTRWVGNIGFYADRRCAGLADGEISEVVKYAKEHGIGYIVIDSNAVPRRRPKLAPLLDPSNYDGLRPVYAREEFQTRVIIYEVL